MSPDEYYWRKLLQVLQYIRSTIHMPLILIMDKLKIIKWWVETSYAMHIDCLIHTGAKMSLGWVSDSVIFKRKNINAIGSTEVELIREDNVIPEFLWSSYFIQEQGFGVK